MHWLLLRGFQFQGSYCPADRICWENAGLREQWTGMSGCCTIRCWLSDQMATGTLEDWSPDPARFRKDVSDAPLAIPSLSQNGERPPASTSSKRCVWGTHSRLFPIDRRTLREKPRPFYSLKTEELPPERIPVRSSCLLSTERPEVTGSGFVASRARVPAAKNRRQMSCHGIFFSPGSIVTESIRVTVVGCIVG